MTRIIVSNDLENKHAFAQIRGRAYEEHSHALTGYALDAADKASPFAFLLDASDKIVGGVRIELAEATSPANSGLVIEQRGGLVHMPAEWDISHRKRAELRHFVIDSSIHPDIQGFARMTQLVRHAMEYAQSQGAEIIFAAPNKNIMLEKLLTRSAHGLGTEAYKSGQISLPRGDITLEKNVFVIPLNEALKARIREHYTSTPPRR